LNIEEFNRRKGEYQFPLHRMNQEIQTGDIKNSFIYINFLCIPESALIPLRHTGQALPGHRVAAAAIVLL